MQEARRGLQNVGYFVSKIFLGLFLKVPHHEHMKLDISPLQQQTPHSCVASVLQMLSRYYDHFPMTHEQAMVLTKCEPDGAMLECIGPILGRKCKPLSGLEDVADTLEFGHPVISNDSVTYIDNHAILIIGYSRLGFHFIDPATGTLKWRRIEWFQKASSEFFILPYRTSTKLCKNKHEHREREESPCLEQELSSYQ